MNGIRAARAVYLAAVAAFLALLTCAAMPPALAQKTTVVPKTNAQVRFSYAPIVKRAAPAVVNVY
ncbi:MAG: hypothetical protein D6773_04360, partial [Alphaproteobacteria bacterium]